jgi:hypothetical protein
MKTKDEMKIKRIAQTAWVREHPAVKIAPPTTTSEGISASLDIWVEEITGKMFVAVRRWMQDAVSIYEVRMVPKVVKVKAVVPTDHPPPEMVQAAADHAQYDRDIVLYDPEDEAAE